MNLNNFTTQSALAISTAQDLARTHYNTQVEQGHLFYALIQDSSALVPRILRSIGIPVPQLQTALMGEIQRITRVTSGGGSTLYMAPELDQLLTKAALIADEMMDDYISVEHFMLALLDVPDSLVTRVLRYHPLTREDFLKHLAKIRGSVRITTDSPESTYDALNKYGVDMVEQAALGKLDPIIGRDEEIRSVIQILARKTKNNPVLIGEAGVGKTAIVEGLAQRIAQGDIPSPLRERDCFP